MNLCFTHRARSAAGALVGMSVVSAASAIDTFIFTINSPQSTIHSSQTIGGALAGTMIGNHDADVNPTGTQTRPGLFGGSGNNPIGVSMSLGASGDSTSHPAGTFRFDADTAAGLFNISFLRADVVNGSAIDVPITLGLLYQTFRTFSPNSLYLGGIELPIPLGQVVISALSFEQAVDLAPGALIDQGGGHYTFTTIVPVTLTLSASALGQDLNLPSVPFALPLSGELDASGPLPLVRINWEAAFQQDLPPDVIAQIPPIENQALDLPTIIPPGQTAHLLLNLVVESIGVNLAQTGALVANGAIRCAADYNNDGSIDHADYDDFLSAFESGGFRADFNGDFTIDFFDYQDFIIAYEGGCND